MQEEIVQQFLQPEGNKAHSYAVQKKKKKLAVIGFQVHVLPSKNIPRT